MTGLLASLHLELRAGAAATLRGCAQLAFCDSPRAGVLVLAGLALVSPFAAFGALIGALFGTVAGRMLPGYSREDWSWGLASFNPAIIGLLWDGRLASGEMHPVYLMLPLAAVMLLDIVLRQWLTRWMLPSLSAAALLTVYVTSALAAPPGGWFWTDAPVNALVPYGLLGAACIFAAMIVKSPFAGVWALLASATAFLGSFIAGVDPRTTAGLWAVTVPLASFGLHAVFLRGSFAGCITGTVAAVVGAGIWIAWEHSALGGVLPPLLAPFILGVWIATLLMRRLAALPIADAGFWRALQAMARARTQGKEVLALVASGTALEPGASAFLAGAWLDPEVPRATFEEERLAASPRSRQAFWDACDRLRSHSSPEAANGLWRALERAVRSGGVDRVAVCDAAVVPIATGEVPVIALHGALERTHCMECGAESTWPPRGMWRRADLRCAQCQGPVVPALTPFGVSPPPSARAQALEAAARCAVVLVLDDPPSDPATELLLASAREVGAVVVFAPRPARRAARRPEDLALELHGGRFLALAIPLVRLRRSLLSRTQPRVAPVPARAAQGNEGLR